MYSDAINMFNAENLLWVTLTKILKSGGVETPIIAVSASRSRTCRQQNRPKQTPYDLLLVSFQVPFCLELTSFYFTPTNINSFCTNAFPVPHFNLKTSLKGGKTTFVMLVLQQFWGWNDSLKNNGSSSLPSVLPPQTALKEKSYLTKAMGFKIASYPADWCKTTSLNEIWIYYSLWNHFKKPQGAIFYNFQASFFSSLSLISGIQIPHDL